VARDVTGAAALAEQGVPICGIGASAGGVAAVRCFLRELPEDLDLADVVILHLAPDHRSALNEIPATATNLPVRQVPGSAVLKPNCVCLIPADRELTIHGAVVEARPVTDKRGSRAPIDMFFRSIAACRGDGLAVILTGTGADGAVGVPGGLRQRSHFPCPGSAPWPVATIPRRRVIAFASSRTN
jgi:chemotaxis response regulator CheB